MSLACSYSKIHRYFRIYCFYLENYTVNLYAVSHLQWPHTPQCICHEARLNDWLTSLLWCVHSDKTILSCIPQKRFPPLHSIGLSRDREGSAALTPVFLYPTQCTTGTGGIESPLSTADHPCHPAQRECEPSSFGLAKYFTNIKIAPTDQKQSKMEF